MLEHQTEEAGKIPGPESVAEMRLGLTAYLEQVVARTWGWRSCGPSRCGRSLFLRIRYRSTPS